MTAEFLRGYRPAVFQALPTRLTLSLARAAEGPAPQSAQVKLLIAALAVLVLLLGALIVVTALRRSLRMRREALERGTTVAERQSPWQAAGQRARPVTDDDDPDKTRPLHGDGP